MTTRYDEIGGTYTSRRSTDLRIAAPLWTALADAASVVNVGAGTGSYEPPDRVIIAVEPSGIMLSQRLPGTALLVQGQAEELPFKDACVDAVMVVLSLHHWSDPHRGLLECARIARNRVVVLTWDPDADGFWLVQDYFPELLAGDRRIFPSIHRIQACLGPGQEVPIPIPADCADGFLGAYWQRPASYLDATVRSGMSSFSRLASVDEGLHRLARDLESGEWRRHHGKLLNQDELDIGYRLVVCDLA